jgi:hypothetical protein
MSRVDFVCSFLMRRIDDKIFYVACGELISFRKIDVVSNGVEKIIGSGPVSS